MQTSAASLTFLSFPPFFFFNLPSSLSFCVFLPPVPLSALHLSTSTQPHYARPDEVNCTRQLSLLSIFISLLIHVLKKSTVIPL